MESIYTKAFERSEPAWWSGGNTPRESWFAIPASKGRETKLYVVFVPLYRPIGEGIVCVVIFICLDVPTIYS
jgi:hypothetical protein